MISWTAWAAGAIVLRRWILSHRSSWNQRNPECHGGVPFLSSIRLVSCRNQSKDPRYTAKLRTVSTRPCKSIASWNIDEWERKQNIKLCGGTSVAPFREQQVETRVLSYFDTLLLPVTMSSRPCEKQIPTVEMRAWHGGRKAGRPVASPRNDEARRSSCAIGAPRCSNIKASYKNETDATNLALW